MTRIKIQVLIVDDSPVDRELLIAIFQAEPDFVVAGQAADAFEAREKIRTLNPDVITLDVSMPGMDGIKFLHNLMRLRPMPVVLVSGTTEAGAAAMLDALEIGAVDFVAKLGASGRSLGDYRSEITAKVRMAAYARVTAYRGAPEPVATPRAAPAAAVPAPCEVATGGIAAIQTVLETLPVDGLPAVVITQHIPAGFSESFATRLDSQLELQVHQASDGLAIEVGHVYIAPGRHQFSIEAQGQGYVCRVSKEERVNLHRPSVQVLFQSVAKHAGARAVGVMLTGMGADGAANEVLPLDAIGPAIGDLVGATRGSLERRVARRRSARGAQPIE